MNVIKRSTHAFETTSIEIEMTEFPFESGEELHIKLEPIDNIEYFGLTGNPENDQTLSFKVGDAYVWVKWDYRLLPMLEEAIAKYKKGWSDYYQSLSEKMSEQE